MQQYIKDLKEKYPRLFEIAIAHKNTAYRDRWEEAPIYSGMTSWIQTAQGPDFWRMIDNDEYDRAKDKYPEWSNLFSIEPLQLEIKNNGLWI